MGISINCRKRNLGECNFGGVRSEKPHRLFRILQRKQKIKGKGKREEGRGGGN